METDRDDQAFDITVESAALAGTIASDDGAATAAMCDIELATIERSVYTDRRLLAEGGMGKVVAARDRRLGRRVAIKELRVDNPATRARFEREAMLTARLEHPGIVGVHEAGRWPSGEPFFAMRVVAGRSFDRVLAELTDTPSRIARIPTVLAVADAIAYAHDQGVIHRDLKPHNVMIGSFGETVVIDWGLAKDLSEREVLAAGSSVTGEGLTVDGAVVGTPAYVSPEQAQGHAVDRTADVYALGALLYELLAGRPPYRGHSAEAILDAVIAQPPPALPAEIPDELVAIASRAMAREPAARYPSAREFAEDLRRFQSGQLVGAHRYTARALVRRWMRRHRAVIATVAVAFAVVAVLGVLGVLGLAAERTEADHQRVLADEQRAKAEAALARSDGLAKFMQKDLRDKLASMNRIDLLEPIARKAIEYRISQGTDAVAASGAHMDLSDALAAKGDFGGALAALELAIRLMDVAPTSDAKVRRDRTVLRNRRGDLLRNRGDDKAALASYREATAAAAELQRADPANTQLQLDVAFGETKIADLLVTHGDPRGGLDAAKRARAILDAIKPATADEAAKVERQLSQARSFAGESLAVLGDSKAAIAELTEAHAITLAIAKRDPAWRTQRLVSGSLQRLAHAKKASGDAAGALHDYEAFEAWSERTLGVDAGNALLLRDHMLARATVAMLYSGRGDHAAARDRLVAALATAEQLAARDATNLGAQADVASMLGKLASVEAELGKLDRALGLAKRAVAVRLELARRSPTNVAWKREVYVTYRQLQDVQVARKDLAGARESAAAGLALASELAAMDRSDTEAQRDLATAHHSLGSVLIKLGKRTEALVELRADLAISETLAARDPTNMKWRGDVALSHSKIAGVLEDLGDRPGARKSYDAAIELADRTPSDASPIPDFAKQLREQRNRCCK